MLVDFAEHGSIERAFVSAETIDLVPAMEKTLNDYLQYCRDRLQLRPSTIQGRTTELRIFLNFLHTRKGRTLYRIQSADLSDFISVRIPMMSISHSDLMPIRSERSDAGLSQFEIVIGISQ